MHLAHLPGPSTRSESADPTELIADVIRLREVRDFIAAGDRPIDADPDFRERLREKLWTIVSERPKS